MTVSAPLLLVVVLVLTGIIASGAFGRDAAIACDDRCSGMLRFFCHCSWQQGFDFAQDEALAKLRTPEQEALGASILSRSLLSHFDSWLSAAVKYNRMGELEKLVLSLTTQLRSAQALAKWREDGKDSKEREVC
jgi:hypothetical protein